MPEHRQMGNSATRITGIVLVIVLVTTIAILLPELERAPTTGRSSAVPVFVPSASSIRAASLGYRNVAADLLWFRVNNHFGEHFRSDKEYRWLAELCDVVTDLDPKAEYVYRFAGMILPWEANQVDAGIRILEKGTQQLPENWLLAYWAGFLHYYFKDDTEKAMRHLRRAAELPVTNPAVANLLARLSEEHSGEETTIELLTDMMGRAPNPEIRSAVEQQLFVAHLTLHVKRIANAAKEFHGQMGVWPASPATLVEAGLLPEVPIEPFGGTYRIDSASGSVTSTSGHQPRSPSISARRKQHLKRTEPEVEQ